jgi:hypothetical protein
VSSAIASSVFERTGMFATTRFVDESIAVMVEVEEPASPPPLTTYN